MATWRLRWHATLLSKYLTNPEPTSVVRALSSVLEAVLLEGLQGPLVLTPGYPLHQLLSPWRTVYVLGRGSNAQSS